ncbi:ABC-type molybdate transport system, periplasmic component [Burkholderiales bacterium JOSHI_001]|nr:ABC-type molybdate transport system, periplasmic component [Burkholderiales bacterium JOSHI_001]
MLRTFALTLSLLLTAPGAFAQVLKVLTAGAMKGVVTALVPGFQNKTGVQVLVVNDTAGALVKRIQGGESFDIAVLTTSGLDSLVASGQVQRGSTTPMGRMGIGVAVKEGAATPSITTPDQFKAAVLGARKLALIDAAAGGSSGIYLQGLFQRLGIADAVYAKAVLLKGGLTAERVVSGEADMAIQQVSELLAVPGVTLVGMLPEEIQNHTPYGFGLARNSAMADAAEIFVNALNGHTATEVMKLYRIQPLR